MDRRHHAARAADRPARWWAGEREQAGEAFDRGALFVAEMSCGAGGEDEQFVLLVMQLERVAGEVFDLLRVSEIIVLPVASSRVRTISRCAWSSIISSPTRAKCVARHIITLV
jgi:hypothetical protein